jgi:protein-tyrosine phosphatase
MAEAVMKNLVAASGLEEHIYVDSAGTHCGFAGEEAYYRTQDILAEHGIESTSRTRRLERIDLSTFDYVLAMDRRNLASIERQYGGGSADIRLFLNFAKQAGRIAHEEVLDPYPDGDFAGVFATISTGCEALLDHLRKHISTDD